MKKEKGPPAQLYQSNHPYPRITWVTIYIILGQINLLGLFPFWAISQPLWPTLSFRLLPLLPPPWTPFPPPQRLRQAKSGLRTPGCNGQHKCLSVCVYVVTLYIFLSFLTRGEIRGRTYTRNYYYREGGSPQFLLIISLYHTGLWKNAFPSLCDRKKKVCV